MFRGWYQPVARMSAQREIRDCPAFPPAIAGVMRATTLPLGMVARRNA